MNKEKTPNCKVVLLGESGVGKTCIISRYINGTYDDKDIKNILDKKGKNLFDVFK